MTEAPTANLSDIKKLTLLAVISLIALMPERASRSACRSLASARLQKTPQRLEGFESCLPEEIVGRIGGGAKILDQVLSLAYEEYRQVLRHYLPGGCRLEIRLVGQEHIQGALREGRGAVLWISQFSSFHLASKMAFHNAGYDTCHLSTIGHPFSFTRFGMKMLNPIVTGVEDRYLKCRVLLRAEGDSTESAGLRAIRELRRHLANNELVSFTVADTAQHLTEVPFFKARLALPTAPINLALAAGAPVLPVFTVEVAKGHYEVRIEPAREANEGANRAAAIQQVAAAYAETLQTYVERFPLQWAGPFSFRGF